MNTLCEPGDRLDAAHNYQTRLVLRKSRICTEGKYICFSYPPMVPNFGL